MAERIVSINITKLLKEIETYTNHIAWVSSSLNDNPSQAKRDYLKELQAERESLILFSRIWVRYAPDL